LPRCRCSCVDIFFLLLKHQSPSYHHHNNYYDHHCSSTFNMTERTKQLNAVFQQLSEQERAVLQGCSRVAGIGIPASFLGGLLVARPFGA